MGDQNQSIKDAIIESAIPNLPFDGWAIETLHKAAIAAGYEGAMVRSVFPAGVKDAIRHFAVMADRAMLKKLDNAPANMKVRDKITLAVRTRLEFLGQYKEAERLAVAFWMRPFRKIESARIVWNTADAIWVWAGDTATDYNHYTKRALLSGVLTVTTFYWLNDTSRGHTDSWAFLDRRISNALDIGRIAGKLKKA